MINAARSMTFYQFDGDEWKQVYDEMWDNDEETVVAYHSHTHTEPRPSPSDVKIASELGEPNAHYVVLGTSDPDVAEIRSFRIVGEDVTEEPIEVTGAPEAVQSYKFAHTPDSTVYDCS